VKGFWWLAGGLGLVGAAGVVLGLKSAYDAGAFSPSDGAAPLPPTGRSPNDIFRAVQKVDPEHNPILQRGYLGQPNWCNHFAALVTAELGCPIVYGEWGTRANDQIAWLDEGNGGWFQCSSQAVAQSLALQGYVVLATYRAFMGSGHMALVLPVAGPMRIAQAGATCRNDISLAGGFGAIKPVFYAHA